MPCRPTQAPWIAVALYLAGSLAAPLHAADGALIPVAAVSLAEPPTSNPVRPAPVPGHATQAAHGADGDGIASIISIESPPDSALPLLSAGDAQGDPRHDLWARIRVGFALPELDSPLVAENLEWYRNRPDYVARMLERSRRYLYYIVEEVERRGMPTEIALLPMVESAFNPKALSTAKAAGLWQFIPSTGRHFGLQQNWWADHRREVMAATHAALDYLQKLYGMFGSWELALAAYNWGEGSVARAIARNQARGEPTDYLSLNMPNETRHYVPRLLAVRALIEHADAYGIPLGVLPNRPYFAQITITQHIDVALAARLAEITVEEFVSLNPHYNRPVIHVKGPTTLLLPVDKVEVFAQNLEDYDKPLTSWRPYQGKRGEKLATIARRHGISVERLKQVNGLSPKSRQLGADQPLLVPGSADAEALARVAFSEVKTTAPAAARTYTVRRGDTLLAIARRHSVDAAQLRAWNGLKSNHLAVNQKLYLEPRSIAAPQRASVQRTAVAKTKRYTVRRGDTLYAIARRFEVEVADLLRWNRLSARSTLKPGHTLTIRLASN